MAIQKTYASVMLIGEISDPTIDVTTDTTINSTPGIYVVSEINPSLPVESVGYLYVTQLNEGNGNILRFHDLQTGLWWVYLADVWITITPETIGALGVNDTAVAAVKLATARLIGGVSFNGTANINLPGVNIAGNQSTTGNAASATKLQTARNINGVSFNGTANITILPSQIGSYSYAETQLYFVQNVRLSAQTMITTQQAPSSALVSYVDGGDDAIGIGYKYVQIYKNGVWVNAAQA